MAFLPGELVDNRFKVIGTCSEAGGMGTVLFIEDTLKEINEQIVLKYCKADDFENMNRFKREIRLLHDFSNNNRVVKTFYSNTEFDPPYFIMKYYKRGDLMNMIDDISSNFTIQEKIVYEMIDCIKELHAKQVFHRDIKPQNFLVNDDGSLVVSDLGLGKEENSSTRFTTSKVSWGTFGFLPPEFDNGGFKKADCTSDIFMLGKSIYLLISRQNPVYLISSALPSPLFYVIDRSCNLDKSKRFQSLDEMKQAFKTAYDILLSRSGIEGELFQLIEKINFRLENSNQYDEKEVLDFIDKLLAINESMQIRVCLELNTKIFYVFDSGNIAMRATEFLNVYKKMVESGNYGWGFAEKIAMNMKKIISLSNVSNENKTLALELAIDAAYRMNRFAAMETCTSIIVSIDNDDFGIKVASMLQKYDYYFIQNIEPSTCKNNYIRNVILLKKKL